MDLDLDIRTSGRATKEVDLEIVRALTIDDLDRLKEDRHVKPKPLTRRLSERHHALARNLAAGMPDWEVSAITGYSLSHISILKNDPSFIDLLAFYRAPIDRKSADLQEIYIGLAIDNAKSLWDDLEEGNLTVNQKIEISKMTADRTGHGPSSTNVQINVGLDKRLEAARRRVQMIDVTPKEEAA